MNRHLRAYLRDTTLHGFRFLEAAFVHPVAKVVWAILIIISFYLAGLMFSSSVQEARENPFVTTSETVPIHEVPFPAFTMASSVVHPGLHFLGQVFNNVRLDCFGQGEECDETTKKVKEEFGSEIYAKFYSAFDSLAWEPGDTYSNPAYASAIACKKFAQVMGLTVGADTSLSDWRFSVLVRMLEEGALANKTEYVAEWKLRINAYYSWLSSTERRLKELKELLFPLEAGLQEEEESYAYCVEYLNSLGNNLGTFKFNELLVQWAFSLGGSEKQPPVLAGDLLKDTFISRLAVLSVMSIPHLIKFEEDIYKLFDSIAKDKDFPIYILQTYMLTENLLPNFERLEARKSEGWPFNCSRSDFAEGLELMRPFCDPAQPKSVLEGCCPMESKISKSYPSALKQLKYFIAPASRKVERRSDLEDMQKARRVLDYPLYKSVADENFSPAIFGARFQSKEITDDAFQTTFSTSGIAQSFNAKDFWDFYKESQLMSQFYKELVEKNSSFRPSKERKILHARYNGPSFAFEALVNPGSSKLTFTLHSPSDVPDLRHRPLTAIPGNAYRVVVESTQRKVDDAVRAMPVADRKCMLHSDPHNLTLFKEYSFSACMFECQLQRAVEACGCSAWVNPPMLPREGGKNFTLCHVGSANCVESLLKGGFTPSDCGCMEDCEGVEYSINMEANNNSVFSLCPYSSVGKLSPDIWSKIVPEARMYNDYFLIQGDMSYRKTGQEYGTLFENTYQEAVCRSMTKDKLVYLQIYFGSPRAQVFTKSPRVTFTNHLANLGGLLGLFTGMSVLSWAEAIHYICHAFIDKIRKQP